MPVPSGEATRTVHGFQNNSIAYELKLALARQGSFLQNWPTGRIEKLNLTKV